MREQDIEVGFPISPGFPGDGEPVVLHSSLGGVVRSVFDSEDQVVFAGPSECLLDSEDGLVVAGTYFEDVFLHTCIIRYWQSP